MEKTIKDIDAAGKQVLLKIVLNVPFSGDNSEITQDAAVINLAPALEIPLDENPLVLIVGCLGHLDSKAFDSLKIASIMQPSLKASEYHVTSPQNGEMLPPNRLCSHNQEEQIKSESGELPSRVTAISDSNNRGQPTNNNLYVYGDHNNFDFSGGGNFNKGNNRSSHDSEVTVMSGNIESLISWLQSNGVLEDDIISLKNAIKEDGNNKYGEKIHKWIGDMMHKAGTAAWAVGTEVTTQLLMKAISRYYS